MNVKKVNVVVRKVYANNTTQFLEHFKFTGNGFSESHSNNYDRYYYDYEIDEWTERPDEFNYVGDELYNEHRK